MDERRQDYPAIMQLLKSIDSRTIKIERDINGNGREGMKQRLVRVETVVKIAGSIFTLIVVGGGVWASKIFG